MPNNEIDITKNIKIIESFKSELLNSVAELFSGMVGGTVSVVERAEVLSNIMIITYLLGDKLGISYNALDAKALNKIKLGMLQDGFDKDWNGNLSLLGKHIDKTRDLKK